MTAPRPTPEAYCKHYCQYRGTLNCDSKLRCCPLWNYLRINTPKKP